MKLSTIFSLSLLVSLPCFGAQKCQGKQLEKRIYLGALISLLEVEKVQENKSLYVMRIMRDVHKLCNINPFFEKNKKSDCVENKKV